MKVTVNVCYVGDKATLGEGGRLSLSTKPSDTVLRLKQRVAMVEPVPFPEQELQLEGKVLEEHLRLEQLELDGKPLTFVVKATQAILTKQLVELLQARPVSANELSMMYSHKHGATVKQALSILGLPQSLEELLSNSKAFSVASGLVSAAPSSTQVQVLLKSNLGNVVNAAVELKAGPALQQLVEKALAAELIPFEATKVSEQGSTVQVLVEISKETVIQQLHSLLGGGLSITELGDLYCYRYGAPVPRALELLGERGSLKDFLKQNPERFVLQAGCVMKREPNEPFLADFGVLNQRYLDLDAEISSLQEAEEVVERVIQSAMEGLEVCGVIRGGSLGRGTACSGNVDSEVLLLLKGVVGDRAVWLPPLLLAVVAAVSKELQGAEALVHGDAVRVSVPGAVVSLSMDVVGGEVALSAAKRARGFAKVPATAKMTMRLLKWWRNQHQWSSDCRPSDGLLEELVGSVKGLRDQAQAVEVALSALQGLNQEARTYFDQQLLSV